MDHVVSKTVITNHFVKRYQCILAITLLNHCSLETPKRYLANSADPDQMLQKVPSDEDLHCLQIVQSFFL